MPRAEYKKKKIKAIFMDAVCSKSVERVGRRLGDARISSIHTIPIL